MIILLNGLINCIIDIRHWMTQKFSLVKKRQDSDPCGRFWRSETGHPIKTDLSVSESHKQVRSRGVILDSKFNFTSHIYNKNNILQPKKYIQS